MFLFAVPVLDQTEQALEQPARMSCWAPGSTTEMVANQVLSGARKSRSVGH
jgi:hypothetical protein